MNLTGLNADKHRDLKLQRVASYKHAAVYHSASLAMEELPSAALNYPVLFVRDETGFHPVALLSLVQNENQYLDGDNWRVGYVPAALRVYPFRLAGEQVLIDEAAPHFSDAEGEALFTEAGEPSPVLGEALDFLRACHAAELETQHWCKRMAELGLLVERNAEVVSPQGARYQLEGFYAVDAEMIALLPDATLTLLARDGSLALIHAHKLSLGNLVTLAALRDGRVAAEEAASSAVKVDAPAGKARRKQAAEVEA